MSYWINKALDHFKIQEMCDDVAMEGPCPLEFFPDHFKAQEMSEKNCSEMVAYNNRYS